MKTGNVLYHYTDEFSTLLNILEHGFLASYSNEKFAERDLKILMVSFSNHSYVDAINEVDYGGYAIGLNKSWGESMRLHPVSYTTASSLTASSLNELINYSALGQAVKKMSKWQFDPKGKVTTNDPKLDKFFEIKWSLLNDEDLNEVVKIFESIFVGSQELQKYMKQVDVETNSGDKKNSFLDREWRYVPDYDIINSNPVIFKKNKYVNIINEKWKKWDEQTKPHQSKSTLTFRLSDLRYIITKHKKEIPDVFKSLYKIYGKNKVLDYIVSGKLIITSKFDISRNL